MRVRIRRFEDVCPIEFLLQRQRLGFGRYVKTAPRDPAKAEILRTLALQRMDRAEEKDYVSLGRRRRRIML